MVVSPVLSAPAESEIPLREGHLKLLAVRETDNGTYVGGLADLFLEIRPGRGRVFLQTFPLTKTDTQMSTRFAKTIACDFAGRSCSDVDFFYTITSDSPIIAGPSAGASIAALTAALLLELPIDTQVTGTGTINSGGIVGPVGGLKAKLEAASAAGLTKALIPKGEAIGREENETINISDFGKKLGIEIVEVAAIEDVVTHYTGYAKPKKNSTISINNDYSRTMKKLSGELCQRNTQLRKAMPSENFVRENITINMTSILAQADNLTAAAQEAAAQMDYYSSASYCFGVNVELQSALLAYQNLSREDLERETQKLLVAVNSMRAEIHKKSKKTITDLETYMVVRERLDESEEYARRILSSLNKTNATLGAARNLGYAGERFASAESWAAFFGTAGKEFNLKTEVLRQTCQTKLSEDEERLQYVKLYFPDALEHVTTDIENGYADLRNGNYELCLFKASKAKADVDIILGIFGVDPEHYDEILDRKLEVVKESLAKQTQEGIFPIVGYSYYEYAKSLHDTNTLSALLYAEYALELGNLDIYFTDTLQTSETNISLQSKAKANSAGRTLGAFLVGVGIGFLIAFWLLKNQKSRRRSLQITIGQK